MHLQIVRQADNAGNALGSGFSFEFLRRAAHEAGPGDDPGLHGGANVGRHITDRCPSLDSDSDGGELAREMRGVGIDGEPEEELVADGDELNVHVPCYRVRGTRNVTEPVITRVRAFGRRRGRSG